MTLRPVIAAPVLCLFAACTSSSSTSGDSLLVSSSGLLGTVQLPSEAALAARSDAYRVVVADFRSAHEDTTAATTFPTGDASYTGRFAFGIIDDDVTAAGDIDLTVNFDDSNVTGDMSNVMIYEAAGTVIDASDHGLTVTGSTPSNIIDGDAEGHLHVGDDTWVVDAHLHAAFSGDGAAQGVGDIEGSIERTFNTPEQILGYFTVDQNEPP